MKLDIFKTQRIVTRLNEKEGNVIGTRIKKAKERNGELVEMYRNQRRK